MQTICSSANKAPRKPRTHIFLRCWKLLRACWDWLPEVRPIAEEVEDSPSQRIVIFNGKRMVFKQQPKDKTEPRVQNVASDFHNYAEGER